MATSSSSSAHPPARRSCARDTPQEAQFARRPAAPPVIEFRGVSKRYDSGDIGPRPGDVLGRSRGVRVPRRLDRLRQVDGDAAADQGARADRGYDPRRRPRPVRDHAQADPVLPPQRRRRVPGLQAAPEPDRVRQRRLRAPGDGRHAPRDPQQGARHPAAHRPLDEAPQLPRPAVRRRAAARLDRARVRQPPAAAAGRRADRQPRSGDEHRHHAAALPDQPDRARRCWSRRTIRTMVDKMRRRVLELSRGRIVRDEATGLYARDETTREFAQRMRGPGGRGRPGS